MAHKGEWAACVERQNGNDSPNMTQIKQNKNVHGVPWYVALVNLVRKKKKAKQV